MAFEKYAKKVQGQKRADILLFALSTCGWCRKTKNLLDELGVEYRYIDVDLLEGQDKKEVVAEVTRWNPSSSYPTMVINNKSIVGFQEEKIKQALAELPENQRTALLLCRQEELSYEEIAEVLGCSLSATKSLIHRGRETLKQKLKPYLRTGAWTRAG